MTKIDIFSGFLGAGKTTLIRKLIKEAYAGEKLVLIENEFGEIGVDGGFLKDSGVQINEMNSGCICCSLVGDFTKALRQVMTEYAPDRILIEPSGVGKLSDVIGAVAAAVEDGAQLNAPVTVVDATKCKIYAKNFGEFYNDQLESAGCIVLSRTADISEAKLDKALAIIREKNGHATLITTPWDQLEGRQILAAMEQHNTLAHALEALEEEHHHHHDHDEHCDCGHHHEHHHDHGEHCDCGHHHEHHHDHDGHCDCGHHHEHHHDHDEHCTCGCHDHHHHHADEVFASFGWETAKKYTAEGLQAILEALLEESKYGQVLRAKGMVADETGGWLHFDYVPGEINVRAGQPDVMGKICVIGSGMDKTAVAKLFGLED